MAPTQDEESTETVGLSSWPMSSSYPSTSTPTQMEARKMIKDILNKKRQTEILNKEGTEKESVNNNKLMATGITGVLDCCYTSQEDQCAVEDIDEIDGITEEILKPLVKLVFLKILLVDVGISVGDMVTDFMQGLNLVFDGDWNVQWSTYQYGLAVLGVMWLPGIFVAIHHYSGEASYKLFPNKCNWSTQAFAMILLIAFFPLVPSLLYLKLLVTKRRFSTNRQKLVFLELEAKTHELKSIAGAVESPLELILLLWMVFRGILQLPWDQPLASSCVEDSLGRVACLPSLPMASMIFSLLSILKTLTDLNISPLLCQINQAHSLVKFSYTAHLMAQFYPFFVCNVLLRVTAFAFIITYIDHWAVIPAVFLLLLILLHTAIFSTVGESMNSDEEIVLEQSTAKDLVEIPSPDEQENKEEVNMPIILNSILGFFLPVAYVTPDASIPQRNQLTEKTKFLVMILRSQALLINSCVLVVVTVIYCLVTYTTSFNYRTNILNHVWFSFFFWNIVLLCIFSLILSYTLQCLSLETGKEQLSTPTITRHPTTQSDCPSIQSTSSRLVKDCEQSPTNLRLKILLSMVFLFAVLAPSIAGVVLFKWLPPENIQLAQMHENDRGILIHLTHLTPLNSYPINPVINDSHLVDCEYKQKNFRNTIMLLNMSDPTCRKVKQKLVDGLFNAGNPTAIVVLDDNPETVWRLSSPISNLNLGNNIPVFQARTIDWISRGWKSTPTRVHIVSGEFVLGHIFGTIQCSTEQNIYIGQPKVLNRCSQQKMLLEDGKVVERKCIKTTCMKNGAHCHTPVIKDAIIECRGILHTPKFIEIETKEELKPLKFTFLNNKTDQICCLNSTTYFQYFGDDCRHIQNHACQFNCTFGNEYSIHPCGGRSFQEHIQLSKIPLLNCVAQRYYLSLCGEIDAMACDIKKLACGNVRSIY